MTRTIRMGTATIKMNNGDTVTYRSSSAESDIRYAITGSGLATLPIEGTDGVFIVGRNISTFTIEYTTETVED